MFWLVSHSDTAIHEPTGRCTYGKQGGGDGLDKTNFTFGKV